MSKIPVNPWDKTGDVRVVYPEFLDIGKGGEVAQGAPALWKIHGGKSRLLHRYGTF